MEKTNILTEEAQSIKVECGLAVARCFFAKTKSSFAP